MMVLNICDRCGEHHLGSGLSITTDYQLEIMTAEAIAQTKKELEPYKIGRVYHVCPRCVLQTLGVVPEGRTTPMGLEDDDE